MELLKTLKHSFKMSVVDDKKSYNFFEKKISISNSTLGIISVFALFSLIIMLFINFLLNNVPAGYVAIEFGLRKQFGYFLLIIFSSLVYASGWNFVNYFVFKLFGAKKNFDDYFKLELPRTIFTIFYMALAFVIVLIVAAINLNFANTAGLLLFFIYFLWRYYFNINTYSHLFGMSKLKTAGILLIIFGFIAFTFLVIGDTSSQASLLTA